MHDVTRPHAGKAAFRREDFFCRCHAHDAVP
jgi:hypothetical protein